MCRKKPSPHRQGCQNSNPHSTPKTSPNYGVVSLQRPKDGENLVMANGGEGGRSKRPPRPPHHTVTPQDHKTGISAATLPLPETGTSVAVYTLRP